MKIHLKHPIMITNHLLNPFLNSRISDLKYKKVGDTHLKRLINDNQEGRFTGLINSTQSCYDEFLQTMGSSATEAATKKGKTQTVNLIIQEIKKFVSKKEGV